MILSTEVRVKVRNRVKYWEEILGKTLSYSDEVDVPISKLPVNSNKKVDFRCDRCGSVSSRQYQLLNKSELHLCYSCSKAAIGEKNKEIQSGVPRPWQVGELHPRWRKDRDEYSEYKAKVYSETRKHYQIYSKWKNFDKIGRCGVDGAYQLDHIIPIRYGFEQQINPSEIGALSNLQIIPWEDNRSKSDKYEV